MNEVLLRHLVAWRWRLAGAARRQRGQGLVEYALILAFVAIFVVVALKFLQPHINNTLNTVANGL